MLKPNIIIDLDGPILDGKRRHYQCYADILNDYQYDPIGLNHYWKLKKNKCPRRDILALSGAAEIDGVFFQAWLNNIEQQKYLALDILQPAAKSALKLWREQNRRLILTTRRNNKKNLFWQLKRLGIKDLFNDIIVVGAAAGIGGKAAAAADLIKAETLGDCLWIGDTEDDVIAAKKLGVKICAVAGGLRTKKYLTRLEPDYFVLAIDLID